MDERRKGRTLDCARERRARVRLCRGLAELAGREADLALVAAAARLAALSRRARGGVLRQLAARRASHPRTHDASAESGFDTSVRPANAGGTRLYRSAATA